MFWSFENINLNSPALIDADQGEILTYRELNRRTDYFSRKLEDSEKRLVFLFADNSIQSIISYIAILKSNNVCLLLDTNLARELKHELISLYKPEIIISKKECDFNSYNKFVFDEDYFFYAYLGDEAVRIKIYKDLALLLSTSGSTGSPKLVRLSYKNIQSNAESISNYLQINSSERPITSLPISYSYGLSVINSHLLKGSAIVLTNKSFVLRDFWNIFNKFKCTSFAGVPYSYTLLDNINFSGIVLPSLKTMTQAGGRLGINLQKKFYNLAVKKNFRFIIMYGQTEATARISYLPMNVMEEKFGSIGIPIPGGKLNIYNNDEDVTDKGFEGELVFSGENVMLGYAENLGDLSKEDLNKGVLFTGDVGYSDSEGYFYITGRIKRFIKLYGTRINLDEIERIIEKTFSYPTLCIGEDDNLTVLIKSSDITLLAKVKNKISRLYKIHNSLIKVNLTDSFPLNEHGKPEYNKIKKGQYK